MKKIYTNPFNYILVFLLFFITSCTDKNQKSNVLIHLLSKHNWQQVLVLASRSYEVSGLGYLGVDIVLDRCHGPLLLELNARPGLAIQMANQAGLEPRLKWVVEQEKKTGKKADDSAEQKVSMAMAVFN